MLIVQSARTLPPDCNFAVAWRIGHSRSPDSLGLSRSSASSDPPV